MPESMGRQSGKKRAPVAVLVAMVVSLLILVVAVSGVADAQEEGSTTSESGEGNKPLIVPIFPNVKKKDPSDDSEAKSLPKGADLRDSYIIMEDGSVLSVGDWVKGGLMKNDTGAGMSDYQNRLFLGQVARAMVGQDENMVNRSVAHVGPIRTYKAPPPIAAPLRAVQGLLAMIMPGDSYQWSPATDGGGFNRRVATEGGAAILFEEQFSNAVQQTAADFQETGSMLNMLDSYKKAKSKADDTAGNTVGDKRDGND